MDLCMRPEIGTWQTSPVLVIADRTVAQASSPADRRASRPAGCRHARAGIDFIRGYSRQDAGGPAGWKPALQGSALRGYASGRAFSRISHSASVNVEAATG